MNKRLSHIASMIKPGIGVIDVGTDHAYLPVHLVLHGYTGNIIASDINPGPLQNAVNTATDAGVEENIRFVLSDGLEKCTPEDVDCIVIAGMGGDTICGILDRAPWCMDSGKSLILQPVTKAEVLRYWLAYNGFDFLSESLVEDASTVYQIISTRFGTGCALSDAELFTGKYELIKNESLFLPQLEKLIDRFEKAVSGLSKGKTEENIIRGAFYSKILNQLTDMKSQHIRGL